MAEKKKILQTGRTVSRGIKEKYVIGVVTTALLQIIIFIFIFMLWGALAVDKKHSYQKLRNTVATRGNIIEDYLEDKKHTVGHFQENFNDIVNDSSEKYFKELNEETEGNSSYNVQFIRDTDKGIIDLLRLSEAKGAFIVLTTDLKGDSHQGIYIRNNGEKEELLVGDKNLAEELNIDLAERWQENFRITDAARYDYYNLVVDAYSEGDGAKSNNCGYISSKFILYGDMEEIITYTAPLVDKNGKLYGIMGIELDLDDLKALLPYSELGTGSDNMYYIASKNGNSRTYVSEIISANAGTDVSDKEGLFEYTNIPSSSLLQIKREDKTFIASVQKLKLTGLETNSSKSEWVVIGVVNKKSLLSLYNQNLIITIIWLTAFSILGAAIGGYFVMSLSRKMKNMAYQIKNNSPQKDWQLDSSGIEELDFIGEVGRELFEKSLSYVKLADTIDMVNMQIGAIEYDANERHVFCMDRTIDILELHKGDAKGPYMDKHHFEAEVEVLKKSLKRCEEEKDTYYMVSKSGKDKFIRIKSMEYKSKWLVAVMDVTDEVMERKKIEYERDHDILTHLLNRRAFRSATMGILEESNLDVAAVVMIDLDNLKYFNDTYGHEYGDQYICTAASVLGALPEGKALVSRMSGDEFLIFIHGYNSQEEIKDVIDEVHNNLKASTVWVPGGSLVKLRASVGVAWYPDNAKELDELIKYADFAMYESKNNMKGTISEFDEEHFRKNKVLFSGSEELNQLLENPENVKYAFHPIVDARTGEIFAYEVLMRPQIESLRSPEVVMRLATSQSRLYDVELMTWKEALRAADAQKKPGDKYKLFINSVPNHELKSKDLKYIAEKYGHLLSRVVIEIIENEQTDQHCMESKFKWAEQYGMSIALDDFGTGYSNESTLLYINPKFVKIDMSMVMGIHIDTNRQKIVQNLISYTKTRGIKVIAEGIEIYEDMNTLIKLGVDYLQGWYFMKPQYEIKDLDEKNKQQIRECNKNANLNVKR